jgi:hypothetical protein
MNRVMEKLRRLVNEIENNPDPKRARATLLALAKAWSDTMFSFSLEEHNEILEEITNIQAILGSNPGEQKERLRTLVVSLKEKVAAFNTEISFLPIYALAHDELAIALIYLNENAEAITHMRKAAHYYQLSGETDKANEILESIRNAPDELR